MKIGLKPIKFQQANRCLAKPGNMTDAECSSLWVYTDGYECVSCWKMTLAQRIRFLFHGCIWLSVASGSTQHPVSLMACKTLFLPDKQEASDG